MIKRLLNFEVYYVIQINKNDTSYKFSEKIYFITKNIL